MKTLRLLLWDTCNRSCEGCCNKDWDLVNLPRIPMNEIASYDQIILTGGEPMMFPETLISTIKEIRQAAPNSQILLYTAWVVNSYFTLEVLKLLDGMTVTLHEPSDVQDFEIFDLCLPDFIRETKSLRLNIFDGVPMPRRQYLSNWKTKSNIQWIENCPLPENETFGRF